MIVQRCVRGAAAVIGILVGACFATGAEQPAKKLLLIGIDGCRFDALRAAQAPRLNGLMKDGAVAEPIRIYPERYREADTISGPGWSSILCGVWADKHGVLDNEFKTPNYDEYPPFFALLKQARPDAMTASFSDWEPIAKTIMASTEHVHHFSTGEGNVADGYAKADAEIADAAVQFLSTGNPTATFVYLGQVDENGHAHGFHPSVPQYMAAIERVDAYVGRLLDAVAERPSHADEDWLILVTADHGGQGTGHGGGHDVPEISRSFLILSGPSVQPGTVSEPCGLVDASATGLTHLGVAMDPKWELDGKAVGLKSATDN